MRVTPGSALPKSTQPATGNERPLRKRCFRPAAVLAALAVLLVGGRALAEPPNLPPPLAGASERATEPHATKARIVLVGSVADEPELARLLDELLGQRGIAVEISHAERFDPAWLFGAGAPGVTSVFVVLDERRQARLHFRGPRDERYLLRKVGLPNGLDAVGRELVGQVVESSVMALVHSTEGLSREQATAELERDGAAPRPAALATAPAATAPTTPRGSRERPGAPRLAARSPRLAPRSPWELRLGLRYSATWSGAELGLMHGPGLAAGARFRKRLSLGFELGAERCFAQSLFTSALEADVQRSSFYGLFEVGVAFRASQSGFVALGPALELSRARPVSAAPDVTLAAPNRALAPILRGELRYELSAGRFLFGFAARVDVALVKTSYELREAGQPMPLAAPALVRPGGALSVALK